MKNSGGTVLAAHNQMTNQGIRVTPEKLYETRTSVPFLLGNKKLFFISMYEKKVFESLSNDIIGKQFEIWWISIKVCFCFYDYLRKS